MVQTEAIPYIVECLDDMWIIEVRDGITIEAVKQLIGDMSEAQIRYRLWIIPTAINLAVDLVQGLSMFSNSQVFRSQVSAVVCPHDLTFGIGRMFESLAEADGRRVRVFRDQDDALSWLKSAREWDKGA